MNTPLVWISVADAPSARIAANGEVDALLVGDSLAMTVYGLASTRLISLETMLFHTATVRRIASNHIPVIADFPFLTYETKEDALQTAFAFRSIGVSWVKLEGGKQIYPQITALVEEGFSVVGHLGYLPQTAQTFRVVGRNILEEEILFQEAKDLEKKGVKALILECVTEQAGKKIADELKIPVIGIGAGRFVDGQILVYSDLVGRTDPSFSPRFLRKFAETEGIELDAVRAFVRETQTGGYPNINEIYE